MSPLVVGNWDRRTRSDPGGCSLVNGKRAVRPLPPDGGSSFLVTFLEQLECEGVGPDEELLIADAVCDQLAHKLRRQSVILQCGLVLPSAAGRLRVASQPLVLTMPGQRILNPIRLPYSSRKASVKPSTACLVAT